MRSPFPGMDPYLEHPALWPDVHQELITQIRRRLQGLVGPRYYVAIGERVYLEAPDTGHFVPDGVIVQGPSRGGTPVSRASDADVPTIVLVEELEVREPFLEVRDLHSGHHVVTVIEILSPPHKRPGAGHEEYRRRQRQVLGSGAHLLEIDLLRGGEPSVALPGARASRGVYRVVVSRADQRARREVYERHVRDPLPRVAVPLASPDPDVVLDLPTALSAAYEAAAYARRVDYDVPPMPPLAAEDAAWARERIAAWRASS